MNDIRRSIAFPLVVGMLIAAVLGFATPIMVPAAAWANMPVGAGGLQSAQASMAPGAQSGSAIVSAPVAEPAIADGDYVIRSMVGDRAVLDVAGCSAEAGANVQLYGSNGTNAQKWRIAYDADSGSYTITNLVSGKALDVTGASTASGANVQVWDPNGSLAQKWLITASGQGWRIESALQADLALDVTGASAANGANVQTWQRNGTAAQQFEFVTLAPSVAPSDATVEEGAYIARVKASGKVLDIPGSSLDPSISVGQYGSNGSYAQRFYIEPDGQGFYRVISVASGLALDVAGADVIPGANVQQYYVNNTDAQLWSIRANDDGTFTFVNKASGNVLDIVGASHADGANAQAYTPNGTDAQRFFLDAAALLVDGVVTLHSADAADKVIDVRGGSADSGAAFQLYGYNGTSAQKLVVKVAGDTVSLRSVGSGLYLTPVSGAIVQTPSEFGWAVRFSTSGARRGIVLVGADGAVVAATATADGSALSTGAFAGTALQAFCPVATGLIESGLYVIANVTGGRALDIADGRWTNGANAQIYDRNGTGAQAFLIEAAGGGYYRIVNAMTGKALDVAGAVNANGTNVQQYAGNGTDAQLWRAAFSDNGWLVLVNKATGKALDVCGNENVNGANVRIWDDNGTSAQGWRIYPTSYTPDAVLQQALDVVNGRGSATRYIIAVDRANTRVMVFEGGYGDWTPIQNWVVSVGAPGTPTVTGDFTVTGRGYSFGGSNYTCYYWTQFYGNYLFHTVLYHRGTWNVLDGRTGMHISHGCVRMVADDAKWIYDNVPNGTRVVIYN